MEKVQLNISLESFQKKTISHMVEATQLTNDNIKAVAQLETSAKQWVKDTTIDT